MARRPSAATILAATALLTACVGRGAPTEPHRASRAAGLVSPTGTDVPARIAFKVPAFAAVPPRSPISLTTTDGSGLELRSLSAKTRIYGPVAHTEVRLRFSNPEWRQREGRFTIALPQHAFVTRLAMKIDGKMTEADVAETARARAVYEEVVHRRRDPLLVEQHGTNELSARVFPIPAHDEKEIVVGWVADVGVLSPVIVPLRGLPAVGSLDVEVRDRDMLLAQQSSKGVAPSADLRVELPASAPRAIRSGDVVVARVVVPPAPENPGTAPVGRGMIVLVDTSASRAGDLEDDLARLRGIVATLAREEPTAPLTVAAFDQDVTVAYRGPLARFDDDAIGRLRARGALGASDLKGALAWAANDAFGSRARRVVVVSDGLATRGESGASMLRAAARSLQSAGIERVDAIAVGDIRDETSLRVLTSAGFATPGMVIEGGATAEPPSWIASRLLRAVRSNVAIAAPGAARVWPRVVDGAQPGDEAHVVLEVPLGAPARVAIGGAWADIDTSDAKTALPAGVFEKIDAKAKIDALVAVGERDGWNDARRAKVIGISKATKVVSPFTSFIVVETEDDRRALFAPKPVVAPPVVAPPVPIASAMPPAPAPASASASAPAPASAPASASDSDFFAPPPPLPPPAPPTATKRVATFPAHVAKAPTIRMSSTMVSGRLPPEIIQRIVRQNFGRFRACYEEGLRRRGPKLGGRVATKFVIDRDGTVRRSALAESELGDDKVESCITDAFLGLVFSVPEGGIVTVVYPIVFRPPGAEPDETEQPEPRSLMPSPIHPRMSRTPFHEAEPVPPLLAWTGDYLEMRRALSRGDVGGALAIASAARAHDSRDVVALVALGEALLAANMPDVAQRAFGSIADLRPNDADALRTTAARLEHAAGKPTMLSLELLKRAVDDRPDLPHGHHALAIALLRTGAHGGAFEALKRGLETSYAPRYQQGIALLRRDLELVSMAWMAAEPARAETIRARAKPLLGHPLPDESIASTTYALSWETDASMLSLSVPIAAEHIAWASDGYGPDAWIVRGEQPRIPVVVSLRRRGPMGHPLGVVHVMEHDGRGHVTVEPRPFVVMNEYADVSLGVSP